MHDIRARKNIMLYQNASETNFTGMELSSKLCYIRHGGQKYALVTMMSRYKHLYMLTFSSPLASQLYALVASRQGERRATRSRSRSPARKATELNNSMQTYAKQPHPNAAISTNSTNANNEMLHVCHGCGARVYRLDLSKT